MKEELLELLKKYAYKKGDFTLSSGKKSEHYVNCKPVTLSGRGLTLTSMMLLDNIEKDCIAVAGLTLGADPLVSGVAVCSALDNGKFELRRGFKIKKDQKILIVEDVITTGCSAIKAVEKLRDIGFKVDRIVSIVDRQEDGEADRNMTAAHVDLYSLFSLNEICE